MKLTFEEIKNIVTGAARVTQEEDGIHLYRFTELQERAYKELKDHLYYKTFSSSGIKLSFRTDSEKLFLKMTAIQASSRQYFSVDVFVDGKYSESLDNYTGLEFPKDYTKIEAKLGSHSKEFYLGKGDKTVCVHFPWSVSTIIEEVSVDDGAYTERVEKEKKLLVFGDSITQGYDALRPSNRYIAKVAEALGAEELNKAIGGEIFFPELPAIKDDFNPDYISVAYGSNDWSLTDVATFKSNCRAFFENVRKSYPEAKIFAITPIWREDYKKEKLFDSFLNLDKYIRECTEGIEDITVISGFDIVPHDINYFADLMLHPNDEGFDIYYNHVIDVIKKELE